MAKSRHTSARKLTTISHAYATKGCKRASPCAAACELLAARNFWRALNAASAHGCGPAYLHTTEAQAQSPPCQLFCSSFSGHGL
jgi:hypothetical protein